MPTNYHKLNSIGFKSVAMCPCGYTAVQYGKRKSDLGTKTDTLRMKLHEKKCPQATKDVQYGDMIILNPENKLMLDNGNTVKRVL